MRISYTELEARVRGMIKEKRFVHSEGVVSVSRMLAERFGLSPDDAAYIGIYHDAYRYSCDESTPAFCREHGIEVFPEEESEPMLLHGALAAIHFPEDAGGSVPEHFRIAVRHHTLGHKEMGPYGAILYIADYMEPSRKHLDDDDRRRILSGERLEEMIITIMDMQNAYFRREGIKSAAVSDELYGFIRSGGTL